MAEKIRVLIADDHNILREGLISLIQKEPDVIVVGEAGEGAECLFKAQALRPDVVVMDIKMPGLSGIDACRQLKASAPSIKVIMLSMYEDYEYIDRALQVGADGYLLKKVIGAELVESIRKVARGEKALSPQVLEMIIQSRHGNHRKREGSRMESLTPREMEALKLVADGLRNKQIAVYLFLSPKTVEKLLSDIYRKLGVSSRVAAIKLYLDSLT